MALSHAQCGCGSDLGQAEVLLPQPVSPIGGCGCSQQLLQQPQIQLARPLISRPIIPPPCGLAQSLQSLRAPIPLAPGPVILPPSIPRSCGCATQPCGCSSGAPIIAPSPSCGCQNQPCGCSSGGPIIGGPINNAGGPFIGGPIGQGK